MAKGVLGNDPFERGAAPRPIPPLDPLVATPPRNPARAPKPQAHKSAAQAWATTPLRVERPPPAASSKPEGTLAVTLSLASGLARRAQSSGVWSTLGGVTRGLMSAVRAGIDGPKGRAMDRYGRDAALVDELTPLARFLLERYWQVKVRGAEGLPVGPCILVANHAGALPIDGAVLLAALARERADLRSARWLVEEQVLRAPFLGPLLNRVGAVHASAENARRLLGEGCPVLFFPEGISGLGKRSAQRYRLERFGRGGYVKVALRARVPIVPLALVGAEESMPSWARLPGDLFKVPYLPLTPPPLPGRWTVTIGSPFEVSSYDAGLAEVPTEVARINEQVRKTLAQLLSSELADRRQRGR